MGTYPEDWQNVRNYGAAGNGSGDDTNAFQAAANAAAASGGVVYAPAGAYDLAGTVTVPETGILFKGAGRRATMIRGKGSGDVFRMYDSSNWDNRIANGILGGGFEDLTIDVSGMSGTAAGIHAGDIAGLQLVRVAVMGAGLVSSTAKNFWFDNNYYYGEDWTGSIWSYGGPIVFDTSDNISGDATGSFDRALLDIVTLPNGLADGISLVDGAQITDGALRVGGNFISAANETEYAVFRLNGGAVIGESHLFVGVELDDTTYTVPSTIQFGESGNNKISACKGMMDFSANQAFTPSNNAGNFFFDGPVLGDSSLYPVSWQQSDSQTVSANASTIYTNYAGVIAVSNAASYTGLILQAGIVDGQTTTLINVGTGSLTFAAKATSNVADGASDDIVAGTARSFVWNATAGLWYRCG